MSTPADTNAILAASVRAIAASIAGLAGQLDNEAKAREEAGASWLKVAADLRGKDTGKQILADNITAIKRRMVELGHEFQNPEEGDGDDEKEGDGDLDEAKMRELTEIVHAREEVMIKLMEWKLAATAASKRLIEQYPALESTEEELPDVSKEFKIALVRLAAERVVLEALEYGLGVIKRGASLAPRCLTVCKAIKDLAARLAEQVLAPPQPTGPPVVTELDLLNVRLQLETFCLETYFSRDADKALSLCDTVGDRFGDLMEARNELFSEGEAGGEAVEESA